MMMDGADNERSFLCFYISIICVYLLPEKDQLINNSCFYFCAKKMRVQFSFFILFILIIIIDSEVRVREIQVQVHFQF